jgi:hypothetical protein
MVGVAQYYLCLDILLEVGYLYALYRADGSDWHKDGSLYLAMVGGKNSGTRLAAAVSM